MSFDARDSQADRDNISGWVEAGLFVVAISFLNIVYAVADYAGAHPVVFVLYATAFASIGMLLATGLGRDPMGVILTWQSWLYGIASVAMEGFYFLLLGTVSPAEASLTLRLSIPASLFIGWLVFSRTISPGILVGTAIVIAAVLPVFWFLPEAARVPALVLAIACSFIAAIKTFASEFHPHNRAAKTVWEKLRVTGLVVLATAIAGLVLVLPLSGLSEMGVLPSSAFVPSVSAFFHWPTVLCAIGFGAPILLSMNYLTFSSAVKITTENFLATSAFTPLGALALQIIAASLGLLVVPAFDLWLLVLIAIGIVGMLIIVRSRQGVLRG